MGFVGGEPTEVGQNPTASPSSTLPGYPGICQVFPGASSTVTGYLSFVPLISDHSHPTAGGLGVVWHTQNTHKRALRKGDTRRCWVVLPKLFLSTNFSDGLLYARLVS